MSEVPELYKQLNARALAGECSPRQAIKAKYQECCGFERLVERVSACNVRRCPLWAYRPYQVRRSAEASVREA